MYRFHACRSGPLAQCCLQGCAKLVAKRSSHRSGTFTEVARVAPPPESFHQPPDLTQPTQPGA
eukprot:2163083-Heterocapsa_arctica.AAC.1